MHSPRWRDEQRGKNIKRYKVSNERFQKTGQGYCEPPTLQLSCVTTIVIATASHDKGELQNEPMRVRRQKYMPSRHCFSPGSHFILKCISFQEEDAKLEAKEALDKDKSASFLQ